MPRIGFADHLFLRMHHGIGSPVFNQFLWWFDEEPAVESIEKLHSKLAMGLLSRRVESPLVPTARHRWVRSDVAHTLVRSTGAIAADDVRCWAEHRVTDDIDPETGLGWQLSVAPVVDGGAIMSLVCSHMVADGAALVAAVRAAAVDGATSPDAAALGRRPPLVAGIVDDIEDTARQVLPIVRWGARTVANALGKSSDADSRGRSAGHVPAAVPTNTGPWSPPYVVAECTSASWHAAASKWGGTSSSLFTGLLTALSSEVGRARPGDEVSWSLPVNDRPADSLDANSTKIVRLRVTVPEPDDLDLGRIRSASKAAFTEFGRRQNSTAPADGVPLPLIQMLPDAVVARIPRPVDGAEGLCSNLGPLPEDFLTVGGVRARSVGARATFAGADADFARALGGGLTAWATETEQSVTVSVHGMDPDRTVSDDHLRDSFTQVLDRWDLTYRFW